MPKSKPYINNYPPLRTWLDKHDARCDWQKYTPRMSVEQWFMPNGRRFLVIVHADGHGWDVYTAADTNAIDATLADAEARLLGAPARPSVQVKA